MRAPRSLVHLLFAALGLTLVLSAACGGGGGEPARFCQVAETQSCYEGPAGTQGVGLCHAGVRTCLADGTAFGPCLGQVLPVPESCLTAGDDNCNGQVNESGAGCVCVPGAQVSCYEGPAGTQGVGLCVAGLRTCLADGTAFGPCLGQVLPVPESCSTPGDDNCNGLVNEGCP